MAERTIAFLKALSLTFCPLAGTTRMKMSQPLFAFVALLVVHSLVSFAAYRFLTTTTRTPSPVVDSTPVETTTAEQRAHSESSFRLATTREQVVFAVPLSVTLYVIFGYAALAVAVIIDVIVTTR